MISLISAYYKNELMTQDFLENLEDKLPKGTEVVLVNAGSKPIKSPIITKRVDLPKNESFSNSFNAGIKAATGDWICIINNDAFPETTDWLEKLIELAEETGAWITSPANNKSLISNYNVLESKDYYYRVEFFPAICWLMPRDKLMRVGEFDERFLGGNWEDNDFCKRVGLLGGTVVVSKRVEISHLESQTIQLLDANRLIIDNYQKFKDKWSF